MASNSVSSCANKLGIGTPTTPTLVSSRRSSVHSDSGHLSDAKRVPQTSPKAENLATSSFSDNNGRPVLKSERPVEGAQGPITEIVKELEKLKKRRARIKVQS